MKQLINETCPMFGLQCRHCSEEHTYRPFTEIKKDPTSKLYIPVRTGKKKVSLGMWCNDGNKWIEEMHYCPVIWGNSNRKVLVRESKQKAKVAKRTTRTVKPAKKPLRVTSLSARSAKAFLSQKSKKNTVVKKGRGDKVAKNRGTVQQTLVAM